MPLAAGARLGPYEIVSPLGIGGMGEVYRAKDTRLGRLVAIKVVSDGVTLSPQTLARFLREAQAASALNHPNICTIYDVGTEPPFIAMELLEGETLQERLQRGPMPIAAIVDVALATADALEAAHTAGIVHRDIKPANIFLTARGPKILDFGLAKTAAPPSTGSADDATRGAEMLLTEPGNIVGTVSYMSPEQVRGQSLDSRTDLFSFGVMLYEMATGTRPFRGDSTGAIFDAILNQAPTAAVRLNPDVSVELERLIDKCLEKDPALRAQHASDLRSDFHRLKRDSDAGRVSYNPPSPATPLPQARTGAARWRWLAAAGTAAAILGGGAIYYFSANRAPLLTDKDTIVVADFENTTGDAVFDDTLRQGLSVELQQSPFLSLIPDARVQRMLALMGLPKDARLTSDVAQQICERTASAMVLEGSIASLGSQYVLGFRAKNCAAGTMADEQQVQVAKREDVLNALSQVARTFRTRVGESRTTIERHSTPLDEATTPSLEALKAYSTAFRVNVTTGNQAGIPHYRRAVAIDPKFAMAYANMGLSYSAIGESVLAAQSTTLAWQLRERVSEREKFFIEFGYERQVTGNLEKAYQTLEQWSLTYPRGASPTPQSLLGGLATHGTGPFDRVVESGRHEIAESPDTVFGYANLASASFFLGRYDDAESALRQAAERKVQNPDFLLIGYKVAALKGDQAQMDRLVAQAKETAEHPMAHLTALGLARSGRLALARESSRRAIELAEQEGARETAATYQAARAVWEAECGNVANAKKDAMAALERSTGRDVEYAAGLALALSADATRAQTLADDLEKRFPEDTFTKFTYVPVLRGLSALDRAKPDDSIEYLRAALPYEKAVNGLTFGHYLGGLHSAYIRGQALMGAHRYADAIAEFQKVLDHPGFAGLDPVSALSQLHLGRAFALSGDQLKAKAAYDDFFTRWKDADADVPMLKQAKAEYAALP